MKRILFISLFSIGVVAAGLLYLLYHGWVRFNYPDKDEFPILGIDISHHQGKIDWTELRTEEIKFVIIKATEGGDYKDPNFESNWTMSHGEQYKTGAYHFYRLCKNGREQAANFIQTVPANEHDLPPTVDLEFGGNCETNKSKQQILAEVREFLDSLETHYHKKPILYATREFYDEYVVGELTEYPLWIRDIFREPKLKDGRPWHLWQFANRGHLRGIKGYVDLNVLRGDSFQIFQ
jgi:lysozyme